MSIEPNLTNEDFNKLMIETYFKNGKFNLALLDMVLDSCKDLPIDKLSEILNIFQLEKYNYRDIKYRYVMNNYFPMIKDIYMIDLIRQTISYPTNTRLQCLMNLDNKEWFLEHIKNYK